MSLKDKLAAAKDKAAMRDFEVRITETLERTVIVEARNMEEAKDIVTEQYRNSDHVLDADDFTGVSITTLYGTPNKSLDSTRRKEGIAL
jgi:hypothetical protein